MCVCGGGGRYHRNAFFDYLLIKDADDYRMPISENSETAPAWRRFIGLEMTCYRDTVANVTLLIWCPILEVVIG